MISIVMEMTGQSVGVIPTVAPGESGGPAVPSTPQGGGTPEEAQSVGTTVKELKSSGKEIMAKEPDRYGYASKLTPKAFPKGTMTGLQQGTTIDKGGIPAASQG